MAWRPGPQPSGAGSHEYDERDPWTQRFISKTDDGELSLDVNAMNGLETEAGAIFVELIRQQAERPNSPADFSVSSWMPGYDMGRHYQQHPPAMRMDPPMAQYEPFRRTYVSDPTCVPQLRFANVPDAGADHHTREARCHWRRGGRTWSRVPRFRKGETAFTHDPNHKPSQAVVDKWYRTEAGSKNTLAGRVEESRWQSCHSMQSGREPRKPTRSRLPLDQQKKPGPGPASYHMRDPWDVRDVCGTVPKSSMFCEPVRRPRPQTTAFTLPPPGERDMSVVTSAASSSICDDSSAFSLREGPGRPVTATESAASGLTAGKTTGHHPLPRKKGSLRKQRSVCASEGLRPERHPKTKHSAGRRPSEHHPQQSSTIARVGRVRPPTVGPLSFARAERSTITDECRRKEENYGKKAVRLLTREGDVLVTVTRRRESVWGSQDPIGLRLDCTSAAAAQSKSGGAVAESRSALQERKKPTHDDDGRPAVGRSSCFSSSIRSRAGGGSGEGGNAVCGAKTVVRSRPSGGASVKGGGTLEAQAMRLLPGDLAASPTAYREPGRAELPLVFRATSAPIVRVAPSSRVAKMINRGVAARADNSRGVAIMPGKGSVDRDASALGAALGADGVAEWRQEKEEQEAQIARIDRAAEDVAAKCGGGGRDGGGDGALKTSIRTRLPASNPGFASDRPRGLGEDDDGSCDFVSSTVWSATVVNAGEV